MFRNKTWENIMQNSVTRRAFLKGTAAVMTMATPIIIPREVFSAPGTPGANDRIGVAGIGVGRQGGFDFALLCKNKRARPVCVADVWLSRAKSVAKKSGGIDAFQDYRRVLDRKDVDAILTATPEHWRGLICLESCKAGKHVYGEKPISLTIREGRMLVEAARKYNVVFQTGSQQRSQIPNQVACQFILNGGLGKIQEVFSANYPSPWLNDLPGEPVPDDLDWNTWCGPTDPVPFNKDLFAPRANPGWLSFRPYSGGEMTGWGTHGFDQIQAALGLETTGPVEILVEGEKLRPITYTAAENRNRGNKFCSVPQLAFVYANGIKVSLSTGNQGGGIFVGEKGKMEIFRGKFTSNPKEFETELQKQVKDKRAANTAGEEWTGHLDNWLRAIALGEKLRSDIETGHRSASICHLLNIARYVGRSLKWDPEKEIFPGDEEANSFLTRKVRKGYEMNL